MCNVLSELLSLQSTGLTNSELNGDMQVKLSHSFKVSWNPRDEVSNGSACYHVTLC